MTYTKILETLKRYWQILVGAVLTIIAILFFKGRDKIKIKPQVKQIEKEVKQIETEVKRIEEKKEIELKQIEKTEDQIKEVEIKLDNIPNQIKPENAKAKAEYLKTRKPRKKPSK